MPLFRRRRPGTRPATPAPPPAPPPPAAAAPAAVAAAGTPEALAAAIRSDFPPFRGQTYDELSAGLSALLERHGADGTAAAARVVAEYAEGMHEGVLAAVAEHNRVRGTDLRLDGFDYVAVHRAAGSMLRRPSQATGHHPWVHLDAALRVLAAHAADLDPPTRAATLDHLLRLVDLAVARAEYALGGTDTRDVLALQRLLAATAAVRSAAGDPPLPPYVDRLRGSAGIVEVRTPPEFVTTEIRTDGVRVGRSVSDAAGELDLGALLREHLTGR